MEDLVLNGSSKIGGGSFHHVEINGAGTVEGDLECARLVCNGAGKVSGDVIAKEAIFKGSTRVSGDMHSKEVVINGHGSISGDLITMQLECNGAVTVNGNIKAENIQLNGLTKGGADIEGENVEVDGVLQLQGLLNADNIKINLEGKSFAKEIGGGSISVKRRNSLSLLEKLKLGFSKTLEVELIEADNIYLEHTKVSIVRGNSITLGPGCDIDMVEYQNEFQSHKDSKVKENKKTE
ncbi:polymer-forming cytoskeletal protein [Sutcliffiella rhizosphaerae]|uniref:Polymer-forming cytoskeletal protein n=1 Tax=Sutcliffiella rhizosphaerae TaxID=2880967 RepID=A0ABM8YJE0_9BACI|nr:polymer-forming cytoskeletal protein [Sutcliffiella rhizosphaerae]CAG9619973.1 hypothetical protein BACCIP111883_00741 [Sutcliffiella rhizosphaerae]